MKLLILTFLLLSQLLADAIPQDKKLLLVYTVMQGCPWCHKMDREIIDDPATRKILQKQYIILKIVRESGDMPLFLKPVYFPTTYILSADGNTILEEFPGYMQKKRFLEYLDDLYQLESESK